MKQKCLFFQELERERERERERMPVEHVCVRERERKRHTRTQVCAHVHTRTHAPPSELTVKEVHPQTSSAWVAVWNEVRGLIRRETKT